MFQCVHIQAALFQSFYIPFKLGITADRSHASDFQVLEQLLCIRKAFSLAGSGIFNGFHCFFIGNLKLKRKPFLGNDLPIKKFKGF